LHAGIFFYSRNLHDMPVFIASLNSGSNGNCYYVGSNTDAVLIDAGISCREIEKRMKRLGIEMEKVKAIFISHEHSDHISGLEVTARKFNLPVYITDATLQNSPLKIEPSQQNDFKGYEPISVGDLTVIPFPKSHDAADPYSFVIEHLEIRVGVFTDIGHNCEHVIANFKQCHAVFLEANYDEKMLAEGGYPLYLQRRIRGDKGHLSNEQALELFTGHRAPYLSHLLLSHLSKNNNSPELALGLFEKNAGNTNVRVASRYHESELIQIDTNLAKEPFRLPITKRTDQQLSLF